MGTARVKPRGVRTLRGAVSYERQVYECPRCRRSYAPLDREMNVLPHEQMTLGVVKKIACEVSHASFPEAGPNVKHQLGMEVSVSECHRVAQQWGPRLDTLQRRREAGWMTPWSENSRPARPERSPARVVLEADATSTLTGRGELESEIGYLESGRERMDYARYRAEGRLVGSGAVEGTCKHLVKRRYNMTGARWKRANIPWVLALRLSIFNGEWDADWQAIREAA